MKAEGSTKPAEVSIDVVKDDPWKVVQKQKKKEKTSGRSEK